MFSKLGMKVSGTGLAKRNSKDKTIELLDDFQFDDQLKPDAKHVIEQFKESGVHSIIASGDRLSAVEAVAKELGITEYYASLSPVQKADLIQNLKTQECGSNQSIAMVGDGINDGVALSHSDVSLSFVGASDLAQQQSQIVLMNPSLTSVARSFRWAHVIRRNLHRGLFFAFIFNAIGIPLAAFGFVNPEVAGLMMALSSISVVVNAWFGYLTSTSVTSMK